VRCFIIGVVFWLSLALSSHINLTFWLWRIVPENTLPRQYSVEGCVRNKYMRRGPLESPMRAVGVGDSRSERRCWDFNGGGMWVWKRWNRQGDRGCWDFRD
jgi:hypothetical protein